MPWSKKRPKVTVPEVFAAESDHATAEIDLGDLTPAQAAAAQAAASAVARAERALGKGASLAGVARHKVPQVTHSVGEDVLPQLREVAHQAATAAIDLWQRGERAERGAKEQAQAASEAFDEAVRKAVAEAQRAERAAPKVEAVAEQVAAEVREADAEKARKPLTLLFWIGALIGLATWLLLDERRRDQTSRFATEASTQVRELVRDLKGYDDEF